MLINNTRDKIKQEFPNNDPDGVGDGWRLIDKNVDVPQKGDQAEFSWGWDDVSLSNIKHKRWSSMRYRRRIEPQTFAEHVEEINELGLGYHGPKEKP